MLSKLLTVHRTHSLNASRAKNAHLNAQTRTTIRHIYKVHDMLTVACKHIDTEAGMLSGISRKRSIRSNPYWFTEFCNSQCLSHFAAPFIVVRAETSVAESCKKDSGQRAAKEEQDHTKKVQEEPTARQERGYDGPLTPHLLPRESLHRGKT